MFTGIVESKGTILTIKEEGTNTHFKIGSDLLGELKVDQSISHNGVCLTVTQLDEDGYWVTAIQETLEVTALGNWEVGGQINLERAARLQDRLDGHIVQGHVDCVALCTEIKEHNGSWSFYFKFPVKFASLIIPKGSICINGVSLTVVNPEKDSFHVAIIPYTYEHTNFIHLKNGDEVNLEFDIIGKYLQRHLSLVQ